MSGTAEGDDQGLSTTPQILAEQGGAQQRAMSTMDRVGIITGASRGIGLAVARMLGCCGVRLVINARGEERLAQVAGALVQEGAQVTFVAGDVTNPTTVAVLVEQARTAYGRVDILVNNAGGGSGPREWNVVTDADWQRALDVNLGSVFSLCRAVIPLMRARRYGRIVNVASVAGRDKSRLAGPQYTAAKAGLLGLTRHLAWDLAAVGITVNAVAPGLVLTERIGRQWNLLPEKEREELLAQVPMRRLAAPEEIAAAVCFLTSENASYITGSCLDVNGGSYMG